MGTVDSSVRSYAAQASKTACPPLQEFAVPEENVRKAKYCQNCGGFLGSYSSKSPCCSSFTSESKFVSSLLAPFNQEHKQLHSICQRVHGSLQSLNTQLQSERTLAEPAYLARVLHKPTASWRIAQLTETEHYSFAVENATAKLVKDVGEVLTAKANQGLISLVGMPIIHRGY